MDRTGWVSSLSLVLFPFLSLSSSLPSPHWGLQAPSGGMDWTEQALDPNRHSPPSFCPSDDLDPWERAEREAGGSERLGSAWGDVSGPSEAAESRAAVPGPERTQS